MASTINWTAEAELWMEDIYNYISQDNPKAARKIVNGIYEYVQRLKNSPPLGYVYKKELSENIRILHYGHYKIAYLIKDEHIDILGVFHDAMDRKRYLF